MNDVPTEALPTVRQRTQSLNEVRAAIPEACYQRSTVRASVALLQASILYLLPVVLLGLTDRWWALIVLWPLAGLGVAGLFVLGHDASHGALVDSRRANRVIARICMGPSLHAEASWDLGHNRIHHGYTSRQGFDFVWHPTTVEEYRAFSRLARMRHRLEWSCVGSGLYYLRIVWWQKMWRFNAPGKRRADMVRDKLVLGSAVLIVVAASMVIGAVTGGWWSALWLPTKLFVVPFLVFVQIIGWTVYVHHVDPDIRWWTRRDWTQFKGQMESTTVVRMPTAVNALWFHNIFIHVPHHVDARIPFHQLPRASDHLAASYPGTVRTSRWSIGHYLRATRTCKLYDFEAGHWRPYAAAERA